MRPRKLTSRYLDRLESSVQHVQASGLNVVKRANELTLSARAKRSGRIGTGLRWAVLLFDSPNTSVNDNHLVCRFYDPATGDIGDTAFKVLKPWHLQRRTWDGQTFDYEDGSSIDYSDNGDNGTTRSATDGASEWTEEIHPHYRDGEVFQIMPIPVTGVEDDAGPVTASFAYGTLFANQITRVSGSFVTDGFKAGMTLTVEGTASNDGTYTIQSVAALSLTLTTSTLTSETVSSTLTGTADTAEWMDANLNGRHFDRLLCLGPGLVFDASTGCIKVDQVVDSQASLTLVTGVSHAIVGSNLRITATRSTVTFKKNAAGMLIDYSVAAAANTTSDVAINSCP